ncbi:hypothetical protein BDR07DRAFT_242725 [Suillus spraguei]|nr:hypothetical protein BDR07DRAFT_242725 [Suillus spraguei]
MYFSAIIGGPRNLQCVSFCAARAPPAMAIGWRHFISNIVHILWAIGYRRGVWPVAITATYIPLCHLLGSGKKDGHEYLQGLARLSMHMRPLACSVRRRRIPKADDRTRHIELVPHNMAGMLSCAPTYGPRLPFPFEAFNPALIRLVMCAEAVAHYVLLLHRLQNGVFQVATTTAAIYHHHATGLGAPSCYDLFSVPHAAVLSSHYYVA